LLGQLDRILRISDSEAGVKEEKPGGVVGEEDECRDNVFGLLESDRLRLDILKPNLRRLNSFKMKLIQARCRPNGM